MHHQLSIEPMAFRHTMFKHFWAVGLLFLMITSFPLWFSTPISAYPNLSLLPIPEEAIKSIRYFGVFISVVLTVGLLCSFLNRSSQISWIIIAVTLLLGFLFDQHRLQPWAYQSFFLASLFFCVPPKNWWRWMLPLAVSIYAYSALGKFDAQFLNTVGKELIEFAGSFLPRSLSVALEPHRDILIYILPTGELLVALSLCFRPLRIYGSAAAICMHLVLFSLLGPWAKNHSLGVLIWNVMLIGQHVYLISCYRSDGQERASSHLTQFTTLQTVKGAPLLSALWVWVLIAPSMERIGYWDHWTSWSLYSPHTSRARIEIHQSGFEKLDESILESLSPDHDGDQWYELDLSLWSLSERGVPIYPQARYQLEIAAYISARYDFFDELRVKLQGISDRRTGRRDEKRYFNAKEIQSARTLFWLHPR